MFQQGLFRCITRCGTVGLLVVLLLGARVAHAQSASAAIWARTSNVTKIKPGQTVSFGVNVFPGNPKQLANSANEWAYEWILFKDGEQVDASNGQMPSFNFARPGSYSVRVYIRGKDEASRTVEVRADLSFPVTPAGKPTTTTGPTTKTGTTAKPSTYHPLQGASIFGPGKIEVGQKVSWEGVPDGGADHKYKWVVEKSGSPTKTVRGEKKPGKDIRLGGAIKGAGTMKITFYVWDKNTPESKAAKAIHNVSIAEPAAKASSNIAGYWLWLREDTDSKGRKVMSRVPVMIHPKADNTKIYFGSYFTTLTMRHLVHGPTPVSKLILQETSPGTFNYRYRHQPGNVLGRGTMRFTASTASGPWKNDENADAGTWKWVRPTAAERKMLQKHFTYNY